MAMQGEELKALRKAAGMSQSELADAIGMARETIGVMERGQSPIELRTELAVRYRTEGHFVGLRDRPTIVRHVAHVLAKVIADGEVAADDVREIREASRDWIAAGHGEVGSALLSTCLDMLIRIKGSGAPARLVPDWLELARLRDAWDACGKS